MNKQEKYQRVHQNNDDITTSSTTTMIMDDDDDDDDDERRSVVVSSSSRRRTLSPLGNKKKEEEDEIQHNNLTMESVHNQEEENDDNERRRGGGGNFLMRRILSQNSFERVPTTTAEEEMERDESVPRWDVKGSDYEKFRRSDEATGTDHSGSTTPTTTTTADGTTAETATTKTATQPNQRGVHHQQGEQHQQKTNEEIGDEFVNDDDDDDDNNNSAGGFSIGDLDDNDEDLGLGRYNFDFSRLPNATMPPPTLTSSSLPRPHRVRSQSTASSGSEYGPQTPLHPNSRRDHHNANSPIVVTTTTTSASLPSAPQTPFQTVKLLPSSPIQSAIRRIRSARIESNRKRAERLLAAGDDDERFFITRICLCLSSWCCDITDIRGLSFCVFLLAFFVALYKVCPPDSIIRKWIFYLGISFVLFRVLWRPLYWAIWGRRIERKRRETMELYDDLNGEHGTGGIEIPTSANDMEQGGVNGDVVPEF